MKKIVTIIALLLVTYVVVNAENTEDRPGLDSNDTKVETPATKCGEGTDRPGKCSIGKCGK